LTSGYNVNRRIASLLDQGCVGFVQKPFQIQTLSSIVRAALD
jgi:FixJ family two-component response regulator